MLTTYRSLGRARSDDDNIAWRAAPLSDHEVHEPSFAREQEPSPFIHSDVVLAGITVASSVVFAAAIVVSCTVGHAVVTALIAR